MKMRNGRHKLNRAPEIRTPIQPGVFERLYRPSDKVFSGKWLLEKNASLPFRSTARTAGGKEGADDFRVRICVRLLFQNMTRA